MAHVLHLSVTIDYCTLPIKPGTRKLSEPKFGLGNTVVTYCLHMIFLLFLTFLYLFFLEQTVGYLVQSKHQEPRQN